MSYNKRIQQLSIVFAFVMIIWASLPFLNLGGMSIDSNSIASSVIFVLIGIAYPLVVFKPQWNKIVLLIEGIVFIAVGLIFLEFPYELFFIIIGIIFTILAILAYLRKLPSGLLRFFYKNPK
ncbi:MAG: hypothetical protein FWE58_03795 [Methanobrevibacter sp.]|nr:hypothetical protein [Methanobrevibacter sp.]